MLPFLKNKQNSTGIAMKMRKPDSEESSEQQDDSNADLEICAIDILKAIKTNDIKLLAQALKTAFEIADSEPHVEGEHIEVE